MSKEYEKIRAKIKKEYNQKIAAAYHRITVIEQLYRKEHERRVSLEKENIKLKHELLYKKNSSVSDIKYLFSAFDALTNK